jgi:hypothetical protein
MTALGLVQLMRLAALTFVRSSHVTAGSSERLGREDRSKLRIRTEVSDVHQDVSYRRCNEGAPAFGAPHGQPSRTCRNVATGETACIGTHCRHDRDAK